MEDEIDAARVEMVDEVRQMARRDASAGSDEVDHLILLHGNSGRSIVECRALDGKEEPRGTEDDFQGATSVLARASMTTAARTTTSPRRTRCSQAG